MSGLAFVGLAASAEATPATITTSGDIVTLTFTA
jgi:hypothetical protein